MSDITRLIPPIPVLTPLGEGEAHFIQELSQDTFTFFGCFQLESGEFWWWDQTAIRLMPNISMQRTKISPIPYRAGLEQHLERHKIKPTKEQK